MLILARRQPDQQWSAAVAWRSWFPSRRLLLERWTVPLVARRL